MKLTNLLQLLPLFTIILLCGTACNDDDQRISPMETILMEGNENSVEILMTRTNWQITSVTTLNEWEELLDENNNPLKLEGLGTASFYWGSITRVKEDALVIQVQDNPEDYERGFIINLSTPGIYKEQVIVRQKAGDRYEIKSIAYSLEEDDEERIAQSRLYDQTGYNLTEHTTIMSMLPYSQMKEEYTFSSHDNQSFKLLKGETPLIDAPEIVDGKLQTTDMKIEYSQHPLNYDCKLKNKEVDVEVPPRSSVRITGRILYKWNQITYTLTLTNVRTQEEKVVKGKLVKTFPYDHTRPNIEVHEITLN